MFVSYTALAGTFAAPAVAAVTGFGPPPPQNPATAANGLATMHGDSASSGTTPLPGTGMANVSTRYIGLAAACPTVMVGHDGLPLAVCTAIVGRAPTVHLLDPATGASLASLTLAASGNLFGGVYSYLDSQDRVVVVDGHNDLLRVGHRRGPLGTWRLAVDSRTPLGAAGAGVVGLAPDWHGRVWYATATATVGVVDPDTGESHTLALPAGEQVANSISTVPEGTAVATDHALYLLRADKDGPPQVVWRAPYDRGPARKPGQLSHGTGATPVFFGPKTGTDYLAITDNAAPREHLLVYRTSGKQICRIPVLTRSGKQSGTENAPVASGRSVFVASTYGYPIPALPAGAEPSVPASAQFTGGLTRVDVRPDGAGCVTRWDVGVRSATVPRLSLADGLIYTVARTGFLGSPRTSLIDNWDYTAIDAVSGRTEAVRRVGTSEILDTLQLAGTLAPGRVYYQGTITGILRIAASS